MHGGARVYNAIVRWSRSSGIRPYYIPQIYSIIGVDAIETLWRRLIPPPTKLVSGLMPEPIAVDITEYASQRLPQGFHEAGATAFTLCNTKIVIWWPWVTLATLVGYRQHI